MTRPPLLFGLVRRLVFAAVCAYFSLIDWRELQHASGAPEPMRVLKTLEKPRLQGSIWNLVS